MRRRTWHSALPVVFTAGAVVAALTVTGMVSPPPAAAAADPLGSSIAAAAATGANTEARVSVTTSARAGRADRSSAASAAAATRLHPVTPFAAGSARLGPGASRTLTVPRSSHGLPASHVAAVGLTVSVSHPTRTTTVSASPAGSGHRVPVVSTSRSRPASAATVVPLSSAGRFTVRSSAGHATVTVAVTGWYGTGSGDTFHPLAPARVLAGHRLGAGRTTAVRIVGSRATGIPSNGSIAAVALGVDVSRATAATSVAAYPTHGASSRSHPALTVGRGRVTAGSVVVAVGRDGDVTLRNAHGTATVGATVEGYWTTEATGGAFHAVTPSVVSDVHAAAGQWAGLKLAGHGGVPAGHTASAAVLAVTASHASHATGVTVAPSTHAPTAVSQLRVEPGSTSTQAVVTALSTGGRISLRASHAAHLTVRLLGWFARTASGVNVGAANCGSLPAHAGFGVVAATSGLPYHQDGLCFDAESSWAAALAAPPEYYLVLADPGEASTEHWNRGGPKACDISSDYDAGCAYDYGYEAAKQAYGYAGAHGAVAPARWWLDVEVDNNWGSSDVGSPAHPAANLADIRGALHYLAVQGAPAGIYTETSWWSQITGGSAALSDVPVWGGGAGSDSLARANCKAVSVTGGPALLAQWFTDVSDDHDVAC